jgi:glycosyltransferase 2 family protein
LSSSSGIVGERMLSSKKKAAYWIFVTVIAAICLYTAFYNVEWKGLLATILASNLIFLGAAIGVSTISFCLRSFRWSWFSGFSGRARIAFKLSFLSLMSGYLINNFFPAKFGDIYRVIAVSRKTPISKAYLLTGILDERLFDILSLQVLFFGSVLIKGALPIWFKNVALAFVALVFGIFLAVVLLPKMEITVRWVMHRLPVVKRFEDRFGRLFENTVNGLTVLNSFKNIATFSAFSLAVWMLDGFSALIVWKALGVDIDPATVFIFLTALGFAAAIPATPGSLGIFQVVALFVLTPMGFAKELILAYLLLWQGTAYIVTMMWGIPGVLALNVTKLTRFDPQIDS